MAHEQMIQCEATSDMILVSEIPDADAVTLRIGVATARPTMIRLTYDEASRLAEALLRAAGRIARPTQNE